MKPKARRLDQPLLRALSLGAGVQSTTLALLAAHGVVTPMPDCAIFADTGSEPAYVYEHLQWLRSRNVLPFPVHVVRAGELRRDLTEGRYGTETKTYPAIPYFLDTGSRYGGRGLRACTGPYKMRPIAQAHRRLLQIAKGHNLRPNSVEVWIGISSDEAGRMKSAPRPWQTNRWPLIELGMRRSDCIAWLKANDYPVPQRSACVFCPYRSDKEWARLRALDPAGWQQACHLDEALRAHRGKLKLIGMPYLHRTMRPLAEVTLKGDVPQPDLFNEECAGSCGV